jgi:hypothetical protein
MSVRLTGNLVSDDSFGEKFEDVAKFIPKADVCQLVPLAFGTGKSPSALGAAGPVTAACYWSAPNIVTCNECLSI